jgi:hypothetical protein
MFYAAGFVNAEAEQADAEQGFRAFRIAEGG